MPARLTIHIPHRPARVFTLEEGQEYVVGRDRFSDLPIEDERVSRRHALLWGDGTGWTLSDLESKNGTQVEAESVERAGIEGPCWVSFGGVMARFEQLPGPVSERSGELARWSRVAALQRTFGPGVTPGAIAERALETVLDLVESERGFVLLERDGRFEVAALAEITLDHLRAKDFAGSAQAIDLALDGCRPVVTSDVLRHTWVGPRMRLVASSVRALACVPLVAGRRLLGLVYTDSRVPGRAFTELDLEVLDVVAGLVARAVAVARFEGDLEGLGAVGEELGARWRSLFEAAAPVPSAPEDDGVWREIAAGHRRGRATPASQS